MLTSFPRKEGNEEKFYSVSPKVLSNPRSRFFKADRQYP